MARDLDKYYDYFKPTAARFNARLKAMRKSGNVDVDSLVGKLKASGIEFTKRGNIKARALDEEGVNILIQKVPTSTKDKGYKKFGEFMEMDWAIDSLLEYFYEGEDAFDIRGQAKSQRNTKYKRNVSRQTKIKINRQIKALGGQINEGSIRPDQVYAKIKEWESWEEADIKKRRRR